MRHSLLILMLLVASNSWGREDMANVTAGEYRPLFLSTDSPVVNVSSFRIDKAPVTNREFQNFVEKNPKWQRNAVPSLFAEQTYLSHWVETDSKSAPNPTDFEKPVIYVSWYAAQSSRNVL